MAERVAERKHRMNLGRRFGWRFGFLTPEGDMPEQTTMRAVIDKLLRGETLTEFEHTLASAAYVLMYMAERGVTPTSST
jgi:hypothetical protein